MDRASGRGPKRDGRGRHVKAGGVGGGREAGQNRRGNKNKLINMRFVIQYCTGNMTRATIEAKF